MSGVGDREEVAGVGGPLSNTDLQPPHIFYFFSLLFLQSLRRPPPPLLVAADIYNCICKAK